MLAETTGSALADRASMAVALARSVGREASAFRDRLGTVGLEVEAKGLQDFVTVADKQAEEQIRQSALSSGILEQTRQNADLILRPILEKVAGKPIKFRY